MTLYESSVTLADGCTLTTYHKPPSRQHSKAILLFHGYAEHTGRYRSFITKLSNEGYHVFAHDHRGHGKSDGTRGLVKSVQQLSDDASQVFESLVEQHPDLQWMVFGHSMGGGVAVDFALRHQQRLQGLMLSGPLLALPAHVPEFLKPVGRAVGRLLPALPLVPIDLQALSRDPGVVRRYLEDPLIYSGNVRAGTARALDAFTTYIQPRLSQITLPFWVGHGTLDRVTDPQGSKWLHARAASQDKTLKLYHGLFHELLNEPEQEVVIHDILHWLTRRFPLD